MGRSPTSWPLALAGAGICILAIAIVLLRPRRPEERSGATSPPAGAGEATRAATDSGGDGPMTIVPPGHADAATTDGDAPPTSGSLRLEGRVAFPDGDPVAGARVSLGAEEGWVRWGNRPPSTVTAEDGAFALRGLAPDLYEVTVERPGVARIVFRGIRVERANLPPFELVVERGAILAGRVVGDDGKGVPDVEVTAWPEATGIEDLHDLPRPTTRTDAEGAFRFDTLAHVPHRFRTDVRDPYRQAYHGGPWVPDRHDVLLPLERGAILEGRVIDAQTGLGIIEARVTVDWEAAADRVGGSTGGLSILSGTRGTFRSCLDAPCAASLRGEMDGYRPGEPLTWPRLEPGEVVDGLELRLEPIQAGEQPPLPPWEAALSGIVVDFEGRPVPSATVVLGDAGMCVGGRGGNFHRLHSKDAVVAAGADGSFRIHVRIDGRYQTWLLRAEHPEVGVSAPIEVSRDDVEVERSGVRLALGPAGSIAGIVMGPGGEPVAGVRVELSRFHARCGSPADRLGPEDAWGGRRAAETGPEGRFAFPFLEAAPCRLRVDGRGRLLAAPDRIVEVASGATTVVEIILEEGRSISGTVTAADGTPIRGARIRARGDAEAYRGEDEESTISDQDGVYRIDRLAAGRYHVRAEVDCVPPEVRRSVEAGSTGVDFVFEAPAEVEVLVSDAADGAPVAKATVRFVPVEPGASRTEAEESALAGEPARVPPGTWEVLVEAPGYRPWRLADPVRLHAGGRTRLHATIERGETIAGTVVDTAGEPVHGARVAIRPRTRTAGEGTRRGRDETVLFTAENGTFRATGFAPGTWRVDVRHADHGETTLRVELGAPGPEGKPPGETASLRIVLGGEDDG